MASADRCTEEATAWADAVESVIADPAVENMITAEELQISTFDACSLEELRNTIGSLPVLAPYREGLDVECADEGPPMSDTRVCREVLGTD